MPVPQRTNPYSKRRGIAVLVAIFVWFPLAAKDYITAASQNFASGFADKNFSGFQLSERPRLLIFQCPSSPILLILWTLLRRTARPTENRIPWLVARAAFSRRVEFERLSY
jgi:hypothetical protein